ncbi:MAG TPA: formyltransferase family protein [Methylomirabilota bacterium]|jgi:methionyl-tRNA formyltransferase|nr:formyltransferase family protein [Methylomirabilota bacterium]
MTPPLSLHIVTEEDPFYIPVFFREFFAGLPRDRVVVTGVDITPPLNQTRPLALARKLYAFYGPVDFPRLALGYALAKAKDALLPAAWTGTVRRLAARHGVPSRVVADVNAPSYVRALRALAPDLLVSVAASQIFRTELLSVPRLDAINVHTGPLPQYRGMLPVFWQMYDGRASIGVTIHTMTERIDVGEILLRRDVALGGVQSLDAAIRTMKRQGAQALLELLARYADGAVSRTAMDAAGGAYRSFPRREHAVAFRRRGYQLL